MYLKSYKGAAKGWYEQTREAVGGGGGLARRRGEDTAVVVGETFYSSRVKDKRLTEQRWSRRCSNTGTGSTASKISTTGNGCRSLDPTELTRLLLRSRSQEGKTVESKKKKKKSFSRLVCLKRGMSEGERSATTPRIGWRKLTDPGD